MLTASVHDTKMPKRGASAAAPASRPSLTIEKPAFSTGTQTARPSAVSTPSWMTNTVQATVATTNHTASGPLEATKSSRGAHVPIPATNTVAIAAAAAPVTA